MLDLFKKSPTQKSILFYRDFIEYTGGQQKVADYFSHLLTTEEFSADISFSAATRWDNSNPWFPEYQTKARNYIPADYDYAFVAGMDWQVYRPLRPAGQPVVNLIQHVRHADPAHPLYAFLTEPAVRICVSQEVANAIISTGRVNGPVFVIDNGLHIPDIGQQEKKHELFIFGPKNPELAQRLTSILVERGVETYCIKQWIPREELLRTLASSRIALLLPNITEGFYLPALEAMRYSDIAIVPDCVGNRSFCHNRENCLAPEYNSDALLKAIDEAIGLLHQSGQLHTFKRNCAATLAYHSLPRERDEFLNIIRQLDTLWLQLVPASNVIT